MPPDAILNKVIAERVAAQCKRLREELLHDEYLKRVRHSHQTFHPDHKVIAERVAAQCNIWREELPHHEYQMKVKHHHQKFHPDHAPPLLQDIFTSLCKEFGNGKDARRQETEP